jgi:uncharacterized protein (UPF0264 family)
LLVSVRSPAEASAALKGGAALIDVKEPANGSLGRAPDRTIVDIVANVGGRCPVSAALGELFDDRGDPVPADLSFVKWGLAGYGSSSDWRVALAARRPAGAEVVAVAYADWQCARAPSIDEVFQFAAQRHGIVLIDTHCKDGSGPGRRPPTLLDWVRPDDVRYWCERCRAAGVRIALAGSLGPAEIGELASARPDWFAVRGAACHGGRDGAVSTAKVRELLALIQKSAHPAIAAG